MRHTNKYLAMQIWSVQSDCAVTEAQRTLADAEFEGRAAVARAVKLLAVGERARVVHGDLRAKMISVSFMPFGHRGGKPSYQELVGLDADEL